MTGPHSLNFCLKLARHKVLCVISDGTAARILVAKLHTNRKIVNCVNCNNWESQERTVCAVKIDCRTAGLCYYQLLLFLHYIMIAVPHYHAENAACTPPPTPLPSWE